MRTRHVVLMVVAAVIGVQMLTPTPQPPRPGAEPAR